MQIVERHEFGAKPISFTYDAIEYEADFEGFCGYGDTPETAIEDLWECCKEDNLELIQYANGFVLEEIETEPYDKHEAYLLAEADYKRDKDR